MADIPFPDEVGPTLTNLPFPPEVAPTQLNDRAHIARLLADARAPNPGEVVPTELHSRSYIARLLAEARATIADEVTVVVPVPAPAPPPVTDRLMRDPDARITRRSDRRAAITARTDRVDRHARVLRPDTPGEARRRARTTRPDEPIEAFEAPEAPDDRPDDRNDGAIINGRYRIVGFIANGGMGAVYRAVDPLYPDRAIALKVLRAVNVDSEQLSLFKSEFLTMTSLRHRHVAQVYDFEPIRGSDDYLFSMEFVDGMDIWDATRGMPLDRLLELLVNVCRALFYVHSRGILHLDIKPANVLVSRDGVVKVVDFGLAGVGNWEHTGPLLGTFQYIAAERCDGADRIDQRADLYSLGIMAFELLCGRLPFDSDNYHDLIRMHVLSPLRFTEDECARVPGWLRAVISRLCEKNPDDRYATANDVIQAINEGGGYHFELQTQELRDTHLRSGPFIGRTAQLEQLETFVEGRLSGAGPASPAMWVVGPSGIGKTRLLRELKYRAQLNGAYFIPGQCYEGVMDAYAPIREILQYVIRLSSHHTAGGEWLAERWPLVVGLMPSFVATPLPAAPEAGAAERFRRWDGEQFRLLDQVCELVISVSTETPFVLCFDDLQWASNETAEFISYLVRTIGLKAGRGERIPLAIVGALRSDEIRGRSLEEPIRALRASGDLATVALDPLESQEVKTLLGSMLGDAGLSEAFRARVSEETAGNPYFVEELIRALADSGALTLDGGRWRVAADTASLQLPSSASAALLRRVSFLDAVHRGILEVMAVFERPMTLRLAASVLQMEGPALERALGALEQRQMVLRADDDAEQYRVANVRLRQTLAAELEDPRRRQLHARIARAMEADASSRPDALLAEIADHYWRAEDRDKALEFSLRASDQAMSAQAYGMALRLAERALALLEPREPRSPRVLELVERMGDCHTVDGHHEQAIQCYKRAAAGLEATLDLARVRSKLAGAYANDDHLALSVEEGWQAVRLLGDARPVNLGFPIAALGMGLFAHVAYQVFPWLRKPPRDAAARTTQEALAGSYLQLGTAYRYTAPRAFLVTVLRAANLADRLGSSRTSAAIYSALALVYWSAAFPARALATGHRAVRMAETAGGAQDIAAACRWLGLVYSLETRWDEAIALFERARALYEQVGDVVGLTNCYAVHVSALIFRGRLADGASMIREARKILARAGGRHRLERFLAYMDAFLHAELGELETEVAVERIDQAVSMHEQGQDVLYPTMGAFLTGSLLLMTGQVPRAIRAFERGIEIREANAMSFGWDVASYPLLVRARLEEAGWLSGDTGRLEKGTVERLVRRSMQMTRKRNRAYRPLAMLAAAMHLWMKGQRPQAFRKFAQARALAEAQESRIWYAEVLIEEGRCFVADGQVAAGRAKLEEAVSIFDACGAVLRSRRAAGYLPAG